MIDHTALPKKGTRSVGVARQYCGALGRQANCQSLVSLTLARGEVPVSVGLRLFLSEAWTSDPQRCRQAGVPEAATAPRTKGEIALSDLDRLQAAGLRLDTVLVDAGYGISAAFRHGLDAPIGAQQHDTGAPDVLLRRVSIRNERFEPKTIRTGEREGNATAHPARLAGQASNRNRTRTQPADLNH